MERKSARRSRRKDKADAKNHIKKAHHAFGMKIGIWRSSHLTKNLKLRLIKLRLIKLVILYQTLYSKKKEEKYWLAY